MRSEIGKMALDRTFEERSSLNINIKGSLNSATQKWGIDCMRYEIKDIKPPEQIKRSMELQAESERIKRSKILSSEGEMRSKINIAEGIKQEHILEGQGQAQKILQEANSLCESLKDIAKALNESGVGGAKDSAALNLRLTEQYLEAFNEIMGKSSVLMLPKSDQGDSGGITSPQNVASVIQMYKHIIDGKSGASSH